MDVEKIIKRLEEMKERGTITDEQLKSIYGGIVAREYLKNTLIK